MTEAPETAASAVDPRHRSWRRIRIVALAVVVVTVGLGAVFGSRLDENPRLVDSPLIGQPVADLTLPLLEEEGTLSFGDLRGEVLVVNFWASWCTQCRKEHPALMAANDVYRDRGVRFIGVSFQDQKAAAVGFLDELGRGDGYAYVTDTDSTAAVEFGVYGVPETFFIDRSGTIIAKITGAATAPVLASVLDAVLAGRIPPSTPEGMVQPGPPEDRQG